MKKYFCLILITLVFFTLSSSAVNLPNIFGDHMVLQQNAEVKLWGWAGPFEKITVVASWGEDTIKTVGNRKGEWAAMLKTPSAGGPHIITITGYNSIEIKDVLLGEVWLCSGQSNMEWTPSFGIDHGEEAIAKADHPEIRFFNVVHSTSEYPQKNLMGEWVVCTPETMKRFSAVGYFFGEKVHEELGVPVGLINSSWGGTPAETWTNAGVIEKDAELNEVANQMDTVPWGPTEPGLIYNYMIYPFISYKIQGALWYQGEANVGFPGNYEHLLKTMITSWRNERGYEFPFYYVQIAPYKYGRPVEGAYLRDSQRNVLSLQNTGMVVVSDIGNIDDIHPRNKIDVGTRLANLALKETYGQGLGLVSGPLYEKLEIEKGKARVHFKNSEGGLKSSEKKLSCFLIAGEDKMFYQADAKIDGNTVVVSSKKVKEPVAVRFAWTNTAEPTLFNSAGLPASTFRTDDWEVIFAE